MGTAVISLAVFCTVLALHHAVATPMGMFLHQNQGGPSQVQPMFNPQSLSYDDFEGLEERPKDCFHFFVSRNMSSLLAEATKMLRTIRNPREREWLLTFIYRIKSLAEHLRSHPNSRNYLCLPSDDEPSKKRTLADVRGRQQPELYFVDEVVRRGRQQPELYVVDEVVRRAEGDVQPELKDTQASMKSSEEQPPVTGQPPEKVVVTSPPSPSTRSPPPASTTNASPISPTEDSRKVAPTKTEGQEVTQAMDKKSSDERVPENPIVMSSAPDCDKTKDCPDNSGGPFPEGSLERFFAEAGDIDPMYLAENFSPEDIERYEQEKLRRRIRKALMEELAPEIRKLKTVGGTPEDLAYLWNGFIPPGSKLSEDSEPDFDYEDNGAAIGDLTMNEKAQPERKVAPSLDEVKSTKDTPNLAKSGYDEGDVLVQQLLAARFGEQPSKTTKPLGNQNKNQNGRLMTSTNAPF